MDKQFDELSKSLAEGVSRRAALRKFGMALAGVLLAAFGLSSRAVAGGGRSICYYCVLSSGAEYVCSGNTDPCKTLFVNQVCKCVKADCGNCGLCCQRPFP